MFTKDAHNSPYPAIIEPQAKSFSCFRAESSDDGDAQIPLQRPRKQGPDLNDRRSLRRLQHIT
jgi:hypothetical protein